MAWPSDMSHAEPCLISSSPIIKQLPIVSFTHSKGSLVGGWEDTGRRRHLCESVTAPPPGGCLALQYISRVIFFNNNNERKLGMTQI